MKIGDRCFVHGYVDEIRKDTVIVRNKGGYFGTDPGEVIVAYNSAHPNWIPVSEKLPEEDYCTGRGIQHSAEVLVTIVHHANDDDTFVDTAMTVDGVWQLTCPPDDDPDIPKWCEVTAWMPLPEPWEGAPG